VSNIAYSIPLTNNKKFYIKTPCYYSNPSVSVPTADRCSVKTCNYCIGNTHEFDDASPDFGMPKCDGATSQTGRAISYTPDLLTGRSEFKTIQSPLLTIDNPYTVKLMPFKFYHGNATGSVLPENQMILYDKTNNSMPVIKNIQYQSASAERGDIMYFADRDDVSDSDTADRYLLTNGAYGLSNMIWDIIQLLKA
jgi:hypothetical protein